MLRGRNPSYGSLAQLAEHAAVVNDVQSILGAMVCPYPRKSECKSHIYRHNRSVEGSSPSGAASMVTTQMPVVAIALIAYSAWAPHYKTCPPCMPDWCNRLAQHPFKVQTIGVRISHRVLTQLSGTNLGQLLIGNPIRVRRSLAHIVRRYAWFG